QGGDNLLPYRRPLTPTFDDLQIGAACRGLPAEIHGGESRDDSIVVRTPSPCTHTKSTEKCIDRGTTLSQPPPIAINNINDLDAATPRNCRRSVRDEIASLDAPVVGSAQATSHVEPLPLPERFAQMTQVLLVTLPPS